MLRTTPLSANSWGRHNPNELTEKHYTYRELVNMGGFECAPWEILYADTGLYTAEDDEVEYLAMKKRFARDGTHIILTGTSRVRRVGYMCYFVESCDTL